MPVSLEMLVVLPSACVYENLHFIDNLTQVCQTAWSSVYHQIRIIKEAVKKSIKYIVINITIQYILAWLFFWCSFFVYFAYMLTRCTKTVFKYSIQDTHLK